MKKQEILDQLQTALKKLNEVQIDINQAIKNIKQTELLKIEVKENNTNYANMFKYNDNIIFLSELFQYPFENHKNVTIYLNKKRIEFVTAMQPNQSLENYLKLNMEEQDFSLLLDAISISKQANRVYNPETTNKIKVDLSNKITPISVPQKELSEIEKYIEENLEGNILLNQLKKKNRFLIVRNKQEIISTEEKYQKLQSNYQLFSMFSYAIYDEALLEKLSQIQEIDALSYVDESLKNELLPLIEEKGILNKNPQQKELKIKTSLFEGN